MKKLLSVILICGALATMFAAPASAQVSALSRYGKTLDTVTNTGTKSMTTLAVKGPMQTVTVSLAVTVLTGTLAGVARLYGSLDGVNYSRIRSTQLQGAQVDSTGLDANRKVYHWVAPNSAFQRYQVQVTGSGTTTFTIKDLYVAH